MNTETKININVCLNLNRHTAEACLEVVQTYIKLTGAKITSKINDEGEEELYFEETNYE